MVGSCTLVCWQKIDDICPRIDYLDALEIDRLGRLSGPRAWQFVRTRTYLRQLLASYLQVGPRSVEIVYSGGGKPAVNHNPVYFNLSHSANLLVVALNDRYPLGIDLEWMKPRPFARLIERYFAPQEKQWLKTQSEIAELFYRSWVMKEAHSKLLDIPLNLQALDTVPFLKKESIVGPGQITIGEIEAPDNYKCALAYRTL